MDSAVGLDVGAPQEHRTAMKHVMPVIRVFGTSQNFSDCLLLLGCPKAHQHASLSEEIQCSLVYFVFQMFLYY